MVDIAVISGGPDISQYDFMYLSGNDYFIDENTIQEKGIAEGDEIFFVGLFANYFGREKNYPVLRFGKISLLPEEKIEVNKFGDPIELAHVYLFECQSLSGFSGSPVFFQLDRIMKDGKIRFGSPETYLAGIMKGHYNDIRMHSSIELKDKIIRIMNAGIALVTPGYLLWEIIYSPNEIKRREELLKSNQFER